MAGEQKVFCVRASWYVCDSGACASIDVCGTYTWCPSSAWVCAFAYTSHALRMHIATRRKRDRIRETRRVSISSHHTENLQMGREKGRKPEEKGRGADRKEKTT
eukprot:40913-Eustigmatos_ZCMA.PRE.1